MADAKYGHIFIESDVLKVIEYCLNIWGGDRYADIKDEERAEEADSVLQAVLEGHAGNLKFPADEPIFMVRGRDKRALACVRAYRDNQSPRAPINHIEGIDKSVRAFEKFRVEHADRMKEPD